MPDFPEILHVELQPILNRKCPCLYKHDYTWNNYN